MAEEKGNPSPMWRRSNPMSRLNRRVSADELRRAQREGGPIFTRNPADLMAEAATEAGILRDCPPTPLTMGVPSFDELVHTLHGGKLVTVIGRPGHGKTTWAEWMVRRECEAIKARAAAAGATLAEWGEYALFVSLEEPVLDVALAVTGAGFRHDGVRRGMVTPNDLERWGYAATEWPLWIMGEGARHVVKHRRDADSITADAIWDEIAAIEQHYSRRPSLVVVDHLQLMPPRDARQSKHEAVMENAEALRRTAVALDCPVIVPSQARRDVDRYADRGLPPIPEMGDGEWSASGEHGSWVVLGIAMPARWPTSFLDRIDETWQPSRHRPDETYRITPNTVIIQVNKQRGGRGFGRVTCNLDHQTGSFTQAATIGGLLK